MELSWKSIAQRRSVYTFIEHNIIFMLLEIKLHSLGWTKTRRKNIYPNGRCRTILGKLAIVWNCFDKERSMDYLKQYVKLECMLFEAVALMIEFIVTNSPWLCLNTTTHVETTIALRK